VEELMLKHPPIEFIDSATDGFGFDGEHKLYWPQRYDHLVSDAADVASGRLAAVSLISTPCHRSSPDVHPLNPYQPSGSYAQMPMGMLGPSEMYFKPEAFTKDQDGLAVSGATGPRGAADVAEEATTAASK
jgi:hypothetical protein